MHGLRRMANDNPGWRWTAAVVAILLPLYGLSALVELGLRGLVPLIGLVAAVLFVRGHRRMPSTPPADRGGSAVGALFGGLFGVLVALTVVIAGVVQMNTPDEPDPWDLFWSPEDLGNAVLGGVEIAFGVALLLLVVTWFVRIPYQRQPLVAPAVARAALPTARARWSR